MVTKWSVQEIGVLSKWNFSVWARGFLMYKTNYFWWWNFIFWTSRQNVGWTVITFVQWIRKFFMQIKEISYFWVKVVIYTQTKFYDWNQGAPWRWGRCHMHACWQALSTLFEKKSLFSWSKTGLNWILWNKKTCWGNGRLSINLNEKTYSL